MTAELASIHPLPRHRSAWTDDHQLAALLDLAAAGDHHAFLAFYDATAHLVWRLEVRRYRSGELASVAARRRFVRAWNHADEQAGSGLSPRAWLLSLTTTREGQSR